MVLNPPVLPWVFKAIEKSDIQALSHSREDEIRPILPCLVRMSLIAPLDHSEECMSGRKVILRTLSGIEAVNSQVALLSIDFPALETDVKKEQSLRQKLGATNSNESVLVPNLSNGLALEFECSEPTRRLRLLLSELLFVMAQIREPRQDFYHKSSELFDNPCYLEEVSDVLSIALAELPALLIPADVAEALLHLSNGPVLICRMVANQPDCFREVVIGLVMNGEKQDEETPGGLKRLQAVRLLCQMNPSQALNVRALCVEQCCMPGLAVYITLDVAKGSSISVDGSRGSTSSRNCGRTMTGGSNGSCSGIGGNSDGGDVVSFVTGLLLSSDQQQRTWFAQFVKSAQRRKYEQPASSVAALRAELSDHLRNLVLFTNNDTLPDSQVIHATALLRLYCALKNLAGLKFSEEKEIALLLQLVTCRPPPSAAGVRFVSTGLCMLIACPSLISASENERRASEWIRWLVKEEAYFAGASGVSSSFGAMLLLMAIHFHVQQLSAIIDLVSAALGMKIVTRATSLSRIKYIFTHDVFTEQVVTAHAVKVPVTQDLNAGIPGFLPVHCIYHQLKSRMFTKHKVPIRDWIYRQICSTATPLHPVMPQLIEVFVNSILLPSSKSSSSDTFNEPFTEEEIMKVFMLSSFTDRSHSPVGMKHHQKSSSSYKFLRSPATKVRICMDSIDMSSSQATSTASVKRSAAANQNDGFQVPCVMTSQLLLLYYLLFYEDLRLSNMHQLITNNRNVRIYSPHLFAQLPIRYLLSQVQREQQMYAGVFSSLLKLLVTHYPQLCLVEDWLYQSPTSETHLAILPPCLILTPASLTKAFEEAVDNPGHILVLMDRMICLPPNHLWHLAAALTGSIKCLLKSGIPRKILDRYRLVWLRLNSLFPRRLWVMTTEGLRPKESRTHILRKPLTEDDLVLDPVYVLRCDERVFRCAPILQIVIYILQVYLLSSQTYLTQHMQNNPVLNPQGASGNNVPVNLEEQREKLRGALVLTQEAVGVQLLLEVALQNENEKKGNGCLALQEIRSIICSFLHQAFIKNTTLAKLVHFQGYPKELIAPVVCGVPSMHIAVGLNWIPELLQLPDLEKQMAAMELTSHLALQNAMPPTLSISRLVVNTLATLISVLGENKRMLVMKASLPSLVRIGRAFPALHEDLVHLFISYNRIATTQSALLSAPSPRTIGIMEYEEEDVLTEVDEKPLTVSKSLTKSFRYNEPLEDELLKEIYATFSKLVTEAAAALNIY